MSVFQLFIFLISHIHSIPRQKIFLLHDNIEDKSKISEGSEFILTLPHPDVKQT